MKRKIDDGIQSAVRLPRDLHDRLKAAGGERGMGEEIRKRLERSFETEKTPQTAPDPKMRELLMSIGFVAGKLRTDFDNVWTDRFSFDAFESAVKLLLEVSRPEGESIMKPNPNRAAFFAPDASPESVARAILVNLTWVLEKRPGRTLAEIAPQWVAAFLAAPGHTPTDDDMVRVETKLAERKRR